MCMSSTLVEVYLDIRHLCTGFAGLYKGVVPSTLRGAFIACGELATYDITKTAIKTHLGVQDSIPLHVLCSLITGLVATSVAAPFDMIKTR